MRLPGKSHNRVQKIHEEQPNDVHSGSDVLCEVSLEQKVIKRFEVLPLTAVVMIFL